MNGLLSLILAWFTKPESSATQSTPPDSSPDTTKDPQRLINFTSQLVQDELHQTRLELRDIIVAQANKAIVQSSDQAFRLRKLIFDDLTEENRKLQTRVEELSKASAAQLESHKQLVDVVEKLSTTVTSTLDVVHKIAESMEKLTKAVEGRQNQPIPGPAAPITVQNTPQQVLDNCVDELVKAAEARKKAQGSVNPMLPPFVSQRPMSWPPDRWPSYATKSPYPFSQTK